jgi:hypothetical protein
LIGSISGLAINEKPDKRQIGRRLAMAYDCLIEWGSSDAPMLFLLFDGLIV